MGSKITNVEEHLKQVNDQMVVNNDDKKQLQDRIEALQVSFIYFFIWWNESISIQY